MDGGAWWAAVHGVAKSRTWQSDFTFTFFQTPLLNACQKSSWGKQCWPRGLMNGVRFSRRHKSLPWSSGGPGNLHHLRGLGSRMRTWLCLAPRRLLMLKDSTRQPWDGTRISCKDAPEHVYYSVWCVHLQWGPMGRCSFWSGQRKGLCFHLMDVDSSNWNHRTSLVAHR